MKKVFILAFILLACTVPEKKKQEPFPLLTISDDEWATYEGRWPFQGGVIEFELSLKSGAFGVDSYYKLLESFRSGDAEKHTDRYQSARSQGTYSSYNGFVNKELGICLHDLDTISKTMNLKFKKSNAEQPYEMFFMTRGNDELLICDNSFKPIMTDWRHTLHKRSRLFTVEGYFTFDQDSVEFYESNTRERWKLADLGEIDELRLKYKQLAKVKYQGIYLIGLAYSVLDTTSQREKKALVIKRIRNVGKDPN